MECLHVPSFDLVDAGLVHVELVLLDDFTNLLLNLLGLYFLEVAYEIIAHFLKYRYEFFGNTGFHVFGRVIARCLLFRTHLREEKYFLNLRLSGHQHSEAVDANADTRCGRHTILQGAEEVLVDEHRFVVSLL